MADLLMNNALADYLRLGAEMPFAWGESDCVLWVANWIVMRCGIDPAVDLRGRYSTALSATRLLTAEGGVESCVARRCDPILQRTSAPNDEDVGLVDTAVGAMGAIHVRGRWAVKTKDGVTIMYVPQIMAWSLKCQQP